MVSTSTGHFAPLHVAFCTLPVSLGPSTSVAGILESLGEVLSFNVSQQVTLVDTSNSTEDALISSSARASLADLFSFDHKVLKVPILLDS